MEWLLSFFGGPLISFIRVLPLLLSSPLTARVVQVLEWMEVQGKDVRTGEWSLNEIDVLNKYQVRAPKY